MTPKYLARLAELVVGTFVFTWLGLLLAVPSSDWTAAGITKAAVAAIPAALMLIKGAIGHFIGDPNTTSFIGDAPAPPAQ